MVAPAIDRPANPPNRGCTALSARLKVPVSQLQLGPFAAVFVSTWDNVLGPVNKRVWVDDDNYNRQPWLFDKLAPFAPTCTLNSEIMREAVGLDAALYKFFVLAEIGYAIASFIFTSPINDHPQSDQLFSFSLVLPLARLQHFLPIQQLCIDRIRSMVRKFQRIIKKERGLTDRLWSELTALLRPFTFNIATTGIFLEPGRELEYSVFFPGNETCFELAFLRRAITGHLQTGGVTVVLGHDLRTVNLMVSSLALFLTGEEQRQSRLAIASPGAGYAPDLRLQGLILRAGETEIDPGLLIESWAPSTVITLHDQLVRQTKDRNEYRVLRAETEKLELLRLEGSGSARAGGSGIGGGGRHRSGTGIETPELIQVVADRSMLVRNVLDQVFKPYPPKIKQALLSHFSSGLYRKAHAIIQYVDALSVTAANPMTTAQIGSLRHDLKVNSCDFKILLAFADKLRSDMFATLPSDPVTREDGDVFLI